MIGRIASGPGVRKQTKPAVIDEPFQTLLSSEEEEFLNEGGVGYFFPSAQFDLLEPDLDPGEHRIERTSVGTSLILNWLGSRYSFARAEPFSEAELRLLTSIGAVLDSRYRMIVDATQVEQRFELFRGLPEDRYVSAYIDGAPYAQKVWQGPDRVEDAIEVLRTSSLSTYENRRISTGVLLFGKDLDPCHELPVTPSGALHYSPALTSIRTSIDSVMDCRL